MKNTVKCLAEKSGIRFGTSGIRGKVSCLSDFVCYIFTLGFLNYLQSSGGLSDGSEKITKIALAGDLRESTDRILTAVARAVRDFGLTPLYCGKIPTPAVIYYGIQNHLPSIMVTGSHIPADRNGVKFNLKDGEVLKSDEAKIQEQEIEFDKSLFDGAGNFLEPEKIAMETEEKAGAFFLERYLDFFPLNFLLGKKIIVYQQSAVGRDLLTELLKKFGAEVKSVGRSENFVPIDNEAITAETAELVRNFVKSWPCDALVSTDGDSDRPLVADETGKIIEGDILGVAAAKFLDADSVSATASVNTAAERSGFFKSVKRTKIGSPYVIVSVYGEIPKSNLAVGYERNGGFIVGSDVKMNGKIFKALPTRDSFIPILAVLAEAISNNIGISGVIGRLPKRFTQSDSVKDFPTEKSEELLTKFFGGENEEKKLENAGKMFGGECGNAVNINMTDGARITFKMAR